VKKSFLNLGYESGLFDGTGTVPYDQVMKFADLILHEVVSVLGDQYPPDDCVPIEEIVGCLKEHFGVDC